MIVWGRAEDIQSDVAHVPENWLRTFSVRHPGDIRKFGNSRNSTLLFRSSRKEPAGRLKNFPSLREREA